MITPPRSIAHDSWPPADDPLPVDAVLGELQAALAERGVAVLEAEPGAGKTTRVPLHLARETPDLRMVVLEPRRIAARAAARRLAAQLGEPVGRTVGLTTRDDRQRSAATRIEVVTDGVVLRRLQQDPELSGVDLLVFDEFHERSLEADLALAFAIEARSALRQDLQILVMSATIEGPRVAALLGGAPLIRTGGRAFPVEIEHRTSPPSRFELAVSVGDAAADLVPDGDVLVFLPGAAEIARVRRHLGEHPLAGEPLVVALHGSLSGDDQDAALRPAPAGRRKVVLATDVAETSLTIEGIRGVVDAGWSREPRFDAATAMTGLVTVPASRASAEQRAGRAGRTAPGRCIRLWPEREHLARDPHPRPTILTDDLTGAALEIAAWGADLGDLALLDPPPRPAWERAVQTLRELGAVDAHGRVTDAGKLLAQLPVHPRLGHLLLGGHASGDLRLAAELAALLGDRDPFITDRQTPSSDLAGRIRVLRGARPPAGIRVRRGSVPAIRRQADRLAQQVLRLAGPPPDPAPLERPSAAADDPERAGSLIAQAWPDRVAAGRAGQRGRFRMASGRGATLWEADVLAAAPWLAIAHVDRGAEQTRIHLAAAVDPDELRATLPQRIELVQEVAWRGGDVVAEQREQLGALVLSRAPLRDDSPALRYDALLDGLRQEGLGLLGWDADADELRERVGFLRAHRGDPWPAWDDAALLDDLEPVFGPFLLAARRRADLRAVRVLDALHAQLTRSQRSQLDRLAPTHLTVPSGSRVRIDYSAEGPPVLAVRVQELFGSARSPTVLDGEVPVLLHLLSPARRPVQVTDDLAGFWERSYPQVRSELRGRYPKHAWPEDPTAAAPLRGTRRRR